MDERADPPADDCALGGGGGGVVVGVLGADVFLGGGSVVVTGVVGSEFDCVASVTLAGRQVVLDSGMVCISSVSFSFMLFAAEPLYLAMKRWSREWPIGSDCVRFRPLILASRSVTSMSPNSF